MRGEGLDAQRSGRSGTGSPHLGALRGRTRPVPYANELNISQCHRHAVHWVSTLYFNSFYIIKRCHAAAGSRGLVGFGVPGPVGRRFRAYQGYFGLGVAARQCAVSAGRSYPQPTLGTRAHCTLYIYQLYPLCL